MKWLALTATAMACLLLLGVCIMRHHKNPGAMPVTEDQDQEQVPSRVVSELDHDMANLTTKFQYWHCIDNATSPSASKEATEATYQEISSSFVVPSVPNVSSVYTGIIFSMGLETEPGYWTTTSLNIQLHDYGGAWYVTACGYYTNDADENGRSCGFDIEVKEGDVINASIALRVESPTQKMWVLSGKDETTGAESLRYITEYNAGPRGKKFIKTVFKMVWAKSRGEVACEELPESGHMLFDDISVNNQHNPSLETSVGCGGKCGSQVAANRSSVGWKWVAQGGPSVFKTIV